MEITIASLALLVSAITFFLQRQHNRKSLEPILNTFLHHGEDNNKGELILYLDNHGLGPCFITNTRLYLGGNSYEIVELNDYENAFFTEGFFCQVKSKATVRVIRPLERVELIRLEVENVQQAVRQLEILEADFRVDGLSHYQQHTWCDKDGAQSDGDYPAKMRGQAFARKFVTQSKEVYKFAIGFFSIIFNEFQRAISKRD